MDHLQLNRSEPLINALRNKSRRPYLIIAAAFIALVAAIALVLYIRMSSMAGQNYNFTPIVRSSTVKITDLPVTYKTVGTLQAIRSVDLRPETSGIVREIYFAEGQFVRPGQPLVRLEQDRAAAEIAQSASGIAEAQSNVASLRAAYLATAESLRSLEAQRNLARAEFQRYQNLHAREYVSAQELEQRRAQMQVAEANYDTAVRERNSAQARMQQAQAAVNTAQARLRTTQVGLSETVVRAPFAGQIGAKQFELGDYVSPQQALVKLVNAGMLEVSFNVPERYIGQLRGGLPVEVQTESFPGTTFAGQITFVSPVVSTENRSVNVKATINNSGGQLQPGQLADIRLILGSRQNALMVPEESVIPQGEKYYVYTVQEGKAAFRPVEVGERTPGWVEIVSGIKETDRVLIGGIQKVRDGQEVNDEATAKPKVNKAGKKASAEKADTRIRVEEKDAE